MEKNPAALSENNTQNPDKFGLDRLVFFNDAVFAIAITLLALDIHLPETIADTSDAGLFNSLLNIWPKILGFGISFLVIGAFWRSHHRMFQRVINYDSKLILINLFLLMSICFVPFPTSVLSEYGNRTATILYAVNMAVIGYLMLAIWLYASKNGRLLDRPNTRREQTLTIIRLSITPTVFLLSIGLAFITPDLAKYSWLTILAIRLIKY